jgi:hypothetical protein
MKLAQLKELLKPLIKQLIKESLLEDGIISTIVAEAIRGTKQGLLTEQLPKSQNVTKSVTVEQDVNFLAEEQKKKLKEGKKILLDAIGKGSYSDVVNKFDPFANTQPLSKGGQVNESVATVAAPGPLSGIAPDDPGVSIDGLLGMSKTWKTLANTSGKKKG